MDASQPFPDMLTIHCLGAGYVLTWQGQQLAVETPGKLSVMVKMLLTKHEENRLARMDNPQPQDVLPTVERIPTPREHPVRPEPAPMPPLTAQGNSRPGTQTTPAPSPPPENPMGFDINISRANLRNLIQRRITGEIPNDDALLPHVMQYCPGIAEQEVFESLDTAMEQAFFQAEKGLTIVGSGPGQEDMVIPIHTAGGKIDHEAGLVDLTPQQMIQDYVVDDETGQMTNDGR